MFPSKSFNVPQSVTLAFADDDVDEGAGAVSFRCAIEHELRDHSCSNFTKTSTLSVDVLNDDTAEQLLVPLEAGSKTEFHSSHSTKFLIFSLSEGQEASFGVVLSTKPTDEVQVFVEAVSNPTNTMAPPSVS